MKSIRYLILAFVTGLIGQAAAEQARNWTQASSGNAISGSLQSKSADNSEAKIKKEPRGKDTVTWFVPVPLIRQILFNVQEKQKTGRK